MVQMDSIRSLAPLDPSASGETVMFTWALEEEEDIMVEVEEGA
jgi:hypothetical protein